VIAAFLLQHAICLMTAAAAGILTIITQHRHITKLCRATQQLAAVLPHRDAKRLPRPGWRSFDGYLAQACERLTLLEHRIAQRHPVTGLETREALLSIMEKPAGSPRVLAVVVLRDFNALSAFDVGASEQVLQTVAQRLLRMMPANSLLAQVDRASFAMLFEPVDDENVGLQLDALSYALCNRIVAQGVDYQPRTSHYHVRLDAAVGNAPAVLAQTLAKAHSDRGEANNGLATNAEIFAIEQDLRQAVQKHQFELWYQPVVDARTGAVCSAEALIRWRHPQRGLVPPNVFIPVMEASGLSEEIGNWVLDRAARDAAAWTRQGLDHVKVAVNLSAHQLMRADLDVVVDRMITRHGLPAALLELELTETAAATDAEATRALFKRLRARGVTIVIDDFGAGYASLSQLKRLEFDKLKIDREFVTNVDTDRSGQAICKSIVALAHGLGLVVLGEGVERIEEYEWLCEQGCDLFQGYYFARPLTCEALVSFANTRPPMVSRSAALRSSSLVNRSGAIAA